jgi:hypothetical protein
MLAALGAIASGCSTKPAEPTVKVEFIRPELSAVARQRCADPVRLPDRDMTAGEVTTSWGRDRAALRSCETRRAAAVSAVDGVAWP